MAMNYIISNDKNLTIVENVISDTFSLYFRDKDIVSGTYAYVKRVARRWTDARRLRWKKDNEIGLNRLREWLKWE